jgi:hypothetical protein
MLIKSSIFNTGMDLAQRNIMMDKFKNLKIPIPPLEYQKEIETTLIMMDNINNNLNDMMQKMNDNIKTAFLNSLDDYGNPNGFNIDKLIDLDTNEEIKEVPKKKTKSKSII